MSLITPLLAIYGLVKIENRYLKRFFLISIIFGIFLAKGTSFPLGSLFLILFKNIPGMILYRNTLEKFGLLLPLIYAPLFAWGVLKIKERISSKTIKLSFLVFIGLVLFITNWPLFTGGVVSYGNRDIRVEVPSSYAKAAETLDTNKHRILSLPMMGGAGKYDWEFDYVGIESSEYLFPQPVISKNLFQYTSLGQIYTGLGEGKIKNNLLGLAQFLSSDIIVLRKDLDIPAYGQYPDAMEIAASLLADVPVEKIYESEQLVLFQIPEEEILPLIYVPEKYLGGRSPLEIMDLLATGRYNPRSEIFICADNKYCSSVNKRKDISGLADLTTRTRFLSHLCARSARCGGRQALREPALACHQVLGFLRREEPVVESRFALIITPNQAIANS